MAALKPLSAPDITAAKRLVVKIGSALLVDRASGLRQQWLSGLAMDVAEAKARGTDVVLVSSGSIALGRAVCDSVRSDERAGGAWTASGQATCGVVASADTPARAGEPPGAVDQFRRTVT